MKTIRIKHYKNPSYPTKLVALEDPKLLEKNIPKAWNTKEMAGVIAILLAANLSSCSRGDRSEKGQAIVAPVFDHGDGRAMIGGAMGYFGPPTFLPEDEALQIIAEELGKKGIKLSKKNVRFGQVLIPGRSSTWEVVQKNGKDTLEIKVVSYPGKGKVFEADLFDPNKKVAVEYITRGNYFENGGPSTNSLSIDYDFIEAAQYLNGHIKEKGPKMYFGTFYDPVRGGMGNWASASKEQLKFQVKDFIDWLKGQGVI